MTTTVRKPHPHADVIKAWADGAEIEWRWSDNDEWKVVSTLDIHSCREYRVKPEPKTPTTWYQVVYPTPEGNVTLSLAIYTAEEAERAFRKEKILRLIPVYTKENAE